MCPNGSAWFLRCIVCFLLSCHVVCNSNVTNSTTPQLYRLHIKKHKVKGAATNQKGSASNKQSEQIISSLEVTTTSSPKILFYSAWSNWSKCDHRCIQSRKRHCQRPQKCGNIVLKEEKPCHHRRSTRRRNCQYHQKRRKHKHKRNEVFHVVQISTFKVPQNTPKPQNPSSRTYSQQISWSSPQPHHYELERAQHDTDVISRGLSSHVKYNSKWYGKWSRWSPCTMSCTTQRYRWCKRPALCGNDVIRESAYCYIEGSFCQRWIYRQIQQQSDDENEAETDGDDEYTVGRGNNRLSSDFDSLVSKSPQSLECGTVNHTTARSLLKIIGGYPAQKGRWPWQVAVLNRFKEAFCGGTLVHSRWVLTAAHCIRKTLYVRIGEHDLNENEGTEVELRVKQTVIHPGYNVDTVDNDLALLRLPIEVNLDRYRGLACLPHHGQKLPTHQLCTIIGWGKKRSSDAFGTDILHEATIPIVAKEICRSVYEDYHITDNMFCAGYRRGRKDSCAGDSGGPLLCRDYTGRWTVFGITSFGEGCGKKGKFGIYTKLPNYIKWIQSWLQKEW